jgi:hypothetical protein
MVRLRISPGVPGKLRQRLKGSVKPLRRGITSSLIFAFEALVTFLGCLFAAEVALGRKVTSREPEPERRHARLGPEGEELEPSPLASLSAPLNTAAGCGVGFFGQSQAQCPITGGRASRPRTLKPANGFSRCVYFPPCPHRHAASRISNYSVQDWLNLNHPRGFQSNPRRHRDF